MGKVGIANKQFFLLPRYNTKTEKSEFTLEESDCKRLLKEFVELRKKYEENVPLKISEGEFWSEFLNKNYQYRTEIFNGNNPIFIPFHHDEKVYEDQNIHNAQSVLKSKISDKASAQKTLLDVNYLKNMDD